MTIVPHGECRIPDLALRNIEVKRDHLAVGAPEFVEQALDEGCLAALAAGQNHPRFGQHPRNVLDPLPEIGKFLFSPHQQVGIADFFFQGDTAWFFPWLSLPVHFPLGHVALF